MLPVLFLQDAGNVGGMVRTTCCARSHLSPARTVSEAEAKIIQVLRRGSKPTFSFYSQTSNITCSGVTKGNPTRKPHVYSLPCPLGVQQGLRAGAAKPSEVPGAGSSRGLVPLGAQSPHGGEAVGVLRPRVGGGGVRKGHCVCPAAPERTPEAPAPAAAAALVATVTLQRSLGQIHTILRREQ